MLLFAAKEFNLNKPTITKEMMYCVCGFSTDSGNKMAAHLAKSGCRTAYPSEQEAAKARVDVTTEEATVNKDKTDEDKANEEPDNMDMDTDTAGINDKDGEKEIERLSDGKEEVLEETKKMDENKKSENSSERGKETLQAVENREEEEKMEEDNGDTNDSEKGEKGKESQGDKAKADETEKGTDEAKKPPLPGGLLFGTFFNYMGGDQSNDDTEVIEKKSEDAASTSAEDDNESSNDKMETQ